MPERSIATTLLSDIVGSTKRAARMGDRRWREFSCYSIAQPTFQLPVRGREAPVASPKALRAYATRNQSGSFPK
jgi:hypothetical protein